MAISSRCIKHELATIAKYTPSLMPFTLNDDPRFYDLEMSSSNIFMIGLLFKQQDGIFFLKQKKNHITVNM